MRHAFVAALFCWIVCWTVTAQPLRAVDGDTIDALLSIHLGTTYARQAQQVPETIRVLGVNTPEKRAETLGPYYAAKSFTQAWLDKGPFTITYCERDSLRRILGKATRGDEDLADLLIAAGLGVKR